ncbi:heterokaryon incompatibility [Hyaloscypha hepaticicola]|uniref:Heterokaryon incompatibility n=1 Tax=Hyaloscypha hepaticicola TaxID=2082293 RepID=A0A2J6QIS7_9HELO|nr:heterokaryon incompatibility [Hyaloscypha hepaticicola]
MTLSHRWGDATFIKLLKKNADELKVGILIDHLPQTFRDAVEVTRKFNIHYLWIDSLCIIQDSIDDWNKEALQMSQVYQHAICNIAATGAVDSAKGLFFDKNLHLVRPCKVSIPARQATTGTETRYIVDPEFWHGRLEKAPLIRQA